jgi:hypothetical protein
MIILILFFKFFSFPLYKMYIRHAALGQIVFMVAGVLLLLVAVVTLFVSHHHATFGDDGDEELVAGGRQNVSTQNASAAAAASIKRCGNTQQGARLVVDDHGRLCERDAGYDAETGCCNGTAAQQCSSRFCDAQGCCTVYEHCVVCCMRERLFDWCKNVCRTAGWSAGLERTNCYRGPPSPSPVVVRESPRPSVEFLEWKRR